MAAMMEGRNGNQFQVSNSIGTTIVVSVLE
jgi:hypothetical protein